MSNNKEGTTINRIATYMNKYIFGVHSDYKNLKGYLKYNGIEVYYTDDDSVKSYLRWDSDNKCPRIIINSNTTREEQLFNLAHELGHLVMHWKWLPYKKSDLNFKDSPVLNISYSCKSKKVESKKDKLIEYQANEFALMFLMPEYLVLHKVHQFSGEDVVNFISKEFQVSNENALLRLKKLGCI